MTHLLANYFVIHNGTLKRTSAALHTIGIQPQAIEKLQNIFSLYGELLWLE